MSGMVTITVGGSAGTHPPSPESQIMISYDDAAEAGAPVAVVPNQMSYLHATLSPHA
jgi:hypothetical protein